LFIGPHRASLSPLAIAALCACLLAGSTWAQTVAATSTGTAAQPPALSPEELAVLEAINDYRREQGRAPWLPEPALGRVARQHSQDMAAAGRLTHEGFRRRAAATGSSMCVENLLRGSVKPARAVQLWTQSPAHHDNLLDPAARFAGIGRVGPFVAMLACATPPVAVSSPENGAASVLRP
jgi:uncharacterized protein YkwD